MLFMYLRWIASKLLMLKWVFNRRGPDNPDALVVNLLVCVPVSCLLSISFDAHWKTLSVPLQTPPPGPVILCKTLCKSFAVRPGIAISTITSTDLFGPSQISGTKPMPTPWFWWVYLTWEVRNWLTDPVLQIALHPSRGILYFSDQILDVCVALASCRHEGSDSFSPVKAKASFPGCPLYPAQEKYEMIRMFLWYVIGYWSRTKRCEFRSTGKNNFTRCTIHFST